MAGKGYSDALCDITKGRFTKNLQYGRGGSWSNGEEETFLVSVTDHWGSFTHNDGVKVKIGPFLHRKAEN